MKHLDAEPIIARLTALVPEFRQIGGAAEFAAAQRTQVAMPASFVLVTARDVITTPLSGGVQMHRCVTRFDVAIGVRDARAGGRSQQSAALALADKVVAALAAWTPSLEGAEAPQSIRPQGRGRLLDLTADALWWGEPFEFEYGSRSHAA
jgi:aromatic ring-cleaving dioxygenase